MFASPPNSYVEALSPDVVFGDGAVGRSLGFDDEVRGIGPPGWDDTPELSLSCEDTVRRRPTRKVLTRTH